MHHNITHVFFCVKCIPHNQMDYLPDFTEHERDNCSPTQAAITFVPMSHSEIGMQDI